MKLVCISDTHSKHGFIQPIPEGDVLIFAGDFTGRDSEWELNVFLDWFKNHPHKHKILIAGNHDWVFEKKPDLGRRLVEASGIIYLNDESVTIDGVKFWGSPVQPRFLDWAFNRDRGADIDQHWQLIPEDTDVLITHGPPYGILDTTPMTNGPVGCKNLREHVLHRVKPKIHIFGHIHSAHGIDKVDNITFINAAQITDHYKLVAKFKPVIIDIPTGHVKVRKKERDK